MKKFVFGVVGYMWAMPVVAGLYDVSNIRVDVEAENAVVAKDKALTDVVVQSFPKLIKKIVLDENFVVQIDMPTLDLKSTDEAVDVAEHKRLEAPDNGVVITPKEISALVSGVSVENEKNTPVRYMADVTVHFKPKAVKTYLTERQVSFLDKEPPKMVIVPVFRENENVMVFDEQSPLFSSLKQLPPETDLHTFIVPVGDDIDRAAITPDVLSGTSYATLDTLRSKYRAKMVLVVNIEKTNNVYTVKTIGYPSNPAAGSDIAFAVSSRATNIPAVMTHIMKKTADYLVRQLKVYHLNHASAGGKILAIFNVSSLSEWNAVEKRLKAFNFVDKTEVKALYKKQVFIQLTFSENTQNALDKMANAGFVLIPQSNNIYIWQR